MDLKKQFFYLTIHFPSDYIKDFKSINANEYINVLTGEHYRKRLLYDFGWGQETGFEMLPALPFIDLIELVENSVVIRKKRIWNKYSEDEIQHNIISQSNLYGAISVIMQDHTEELIDFLSEKIKTDYFSNPVRRENYMWFAFSSLKTREKGYLPSGVGTKSYEEILNDYEKWKTISGAVIAQVYR